MFFQALPAARIKECCNEKIWMHTYIAIACTNLNFAGEPHFAFSFGNVSFFVEIFEESLDQSFDRLFGVGIAQYFDEVFPDLEYPNLRCEYFDK